MKYFIVKIVQNNVNKMIHVVKGIQDYYVKIVIVLIIMSKILRVNAKNAILIKLLFIRNLF